LLRQPKETCPRSAAGRALTGASLPSGSKHQKESGKRAIPEKGKIIFLPPMNKTKDNTQDQIQ